MTVRPARGVRRRAALLFVLPLVGLGAVAAPAAAQETGDTCEGVKATLVVTESSPKVVVATAGDDVVLVKHAGHRVHLRDGADVLCGSEGADAVHGNKGDDRVYGGGGADSLFGGHGVDTLDGGDGDDKLRGGQGADCLKGGEGDDRLRGNRGKDVIEDPDRVKPGHEKPGLEKPGEKVDDGELRDQPVEPKV